MKNDQQILPGKNDMLFAFIAIASAHNLSGDTKTVAAQILKRFNRKTGQCDPGTESLARRSRVTRRTVIKATDILHERCLIRKVSHGGHGHRASYQPNWSALRELASDENDGEATEDNVNETSHSTCTDVHIERERTFTQTNISNQSNKPLRPSPSPHAVTENVVPIRTEQGVKGLWRGSTRQTPSHLLVATEQAKKRWNEAMMRRCGTAYGRFVDWITEDVSDLATQAEMKKRGGGELYLVETMHAAGLTGDRNTHG